MCKANGGGACWKPSPAHVLYTRGMDLLAPGQCWGVLSSWEGDSGELPAQMDLYGGAGKEVPQDHLFVSLETLVSPGRLCQASLRKYKHFLEVPSICFRSLPTHSCPQWQDCSLELQAGEQGLPLLLPVLTPLAFSPGLVCESSFPEEKPV